MQRATARCRVKRKPKAELADEEPSDSSLVLATLVQKQPEEVIANAQDDDGQFQPVMNTSWIGAVKLTDTLLDGGLEVELVNRHEMQTMKTLSSP